MRRYIVCFYVCSGVLLGQKWQSTPTGGRAPVCGVPAHAEVTWIEAEASVYQPFLQRAIETTIGVVFDARSGTYLWAPTRSHLKLGKGIQWLLDGTCVTESGLIFFQVHHDQLHIVRAKERYLSLSLLEEALLRQLTDKGIRHDDSYGRTGMNVLELAIVPVWPPSKRQELDMMRAQDQKLGVSIPTLLDVTEATRSRFEIDPLFLRGEETASSVPTRVTRVSAVSPDGDGWRLELTSQHTSRMDIRFGAVRLSRDFKVIETRAQPSSAQSPRRTGR